MAWHNAKGTHGLAPCQSGWHGNIHGNVAPWSLPWTGMILAIFLSEFLVKGIRIWSFRGEQFQPMRFFKLVAHKKKHCALPAPTVQRLPNLGG